VISQDLSTPSLQSHSELSVALNDSLNLRLAVAGPGARAYAFLIDFKIRLIASLLWLSVGFWIFGHLDDVFLEGVFDLGQRSYLLLVLVPALAIYLLYHPIFELLWKGRTPGKKLAGIRVIDAENGTNPSVSQIAIRNIFRVIDSLPSLYALGIVCTFFGARRARIGDLAAGTALVHEATSPKQIRRTLKQIQSKPVLANAHWDAAKSLLERWHGLYAAQRKDLFEKLAVKVSNPSADFRSKLTEKQMHDQLKAWVD
jgi:uncharacterized RDD family membrane protein YckC